MSRSKHIAINKILVDVCVCLCVCRHAKEMLVRVQKERDYHRMHHRRVLQEKDTILTDLKV